MSSTRVLRHYGPRMLAALIARYGEADWYDMGEVGVCRRALEAAGWRMGE